MPKGLKYAIGLVVLIIIALIVIPQFLFTVDETRPGHSAAVW